MGKLQAVKKRRQPGIRCWSGGRDSPRRAGVRPNPRRPVWKAGALPLSCPRSLLLGWSGRRQLLDARARLRCASSLSIEAGGYGSRQRRREPESSHDRACWMHRSIVRLSYPTATGSAYGSRPTSACATALLPGRVLCRAGPGRDRRLWRHRRGRHHRHPSPCRSAWRACRRGGRPPPGRKLT